MRKILLTIIVSLTLLGLSFSAIKAQSAGLGPEDLTVDINCTQSHFINSTPVPSSGVVGYEYCSRMCPRKCMYTADANGDYLNKFEGWCVQNKSTKVYTCFTGHGPNSTSIQKLNVLGIEVDLAPVVLIRKVMLGVLGVAALILIAYSMIATYKYAFSQGQPEKIQEATKIFKSLIIGAIITFSGLLLIQITAMVLGVTGSLVDFNFVPRTGLVVYLYQDDLGKACLVEQTAMTGGQQYCCVSSVWTDTGGACSTGGGGTPTPSAPVPTVCTPRGQHPINGPCCNGAAPVGGYCV